jgi:6-phosphogluconolactonase (cycloisomerase 2 family)
VASPSPSPKAALVFAVYRSELVAYRQDPADGALVPSARTAWSTRAMPQVDPTGHFLFASSGSGSEVTAWRVQPDGAVSPAAHSSRGPGTLHPGGRFGYSLRSVIGPNECEVEGSGTTYAVDRADGSVGEQRDRFVTGVAPRGVAFGAGGRFAYVANSGDPAELYGPCPAGSLTGYSVDQATGRLASLGAPFGPGRAYRFVEADAVGSLLFVLQRREFGNELRPPSPPGLTAYQVDSSTGALSTTASAFWVLTQPDGRDPVPLGLTVEPRGQLAFVSSTDPDGDGQVLLHTLQVGPHGAVAPLGTPRPWGFDLGAAQRPWSLHPSPDGRFAYVHESDVAQLAVARLDPARGLVSSGAPDVPLGADALGVVVVPVPE